MCALVFTLCVSERFFAAALLLLVIWVSIGQIASSVALLLPPFCCRLRQVINNQPSPFLSAELASSARYISLNESFLGFQEHRLL